MDIRYSYIGGGATYILGLRFKTDDNRNAAMHLAVSPETCFSADGDMQADVIYLYPEQADSNILLGDQSLYSAKNLDGLCDLLFRSATIKGWIDRKASPDSYPPKLQNHSYAIDGKLKYYNSHQQLATRIGWLGGKVSGTVSSDIDCLICNNAESASRKVSKARALGIPILSETDFIRDMLDNRPYDDDEDAGITVSVADVAPVTIQNFRQRCAEAGICLANLKKIIINNSKFGTKDDAMFILCNNDKFLEYKKLYTDAPEEQKPCIAEAFLSFVKASPELPVNDNSFELPETMPCVWSEGDAKLEQTMRDYLEGKDPGHWMGTYSLEFTIDVVERTLTSREVIFFGDF